MTTTAFILEEHLTYHFPSIYPTRRSAELKELIVEVISMFPSSNVLLHGLRPVAENIVHLRSAIRANSHGVMHLLEIE